MNIKFTGKNIEITEALKKITEEKLQRFEKYFQEDAEVSVVFNVEKNRQIIEVVIPINGTIIRAEENTDNMYASIDNVIDKLATQITRFKSKLEKRHKGQDTIRFENIPDFEEPEESMNIVRMKKFSVKPMAAEEAILQMELLGHNFYMFLNGDTEEINVVYKRKKGDYGLIEPD